MANKTPRVTLGQYKGLAVTRHVRPVLDRTVDQEVTHRCRLHAYYTPTEGPAKRGDKVTFDSIVLGTGKLTPAIERAFYGHNAGDHFEVEVTYPQDFQVPELSGVTAQFSIRLHAIAEKHIPAADEDFARSRGFDSLEAMKVQIRKEKQAIHETAADRKAGRDLTSSWKKS